MSRIGKQPIPLPDKVEVKAAPGLLTVTGPKGELTQRIPLGVTITVADGEVSVARESDKPQHRAYHGLVRSLLSNMVEGVTEGFSKQLEMVGVGYRFTQKGKSVDVSAGFSHEVVMDPPEGIEFRVDSQTQMTILGIDKQLVGQQAAQIRALRKPEPYKGKGIRYAGEHVRRKMGKRAQ